MAILKRIDGTIIAQDDSKTINQLAEEHKHNLRGADMSGADMSRTNLRGADMSGADMSGANLRWADMSGADMSGANLHWANLSGANLIGADLDFSSGISFWCGAIDVKVDRKIAIQMITHLCGLNCEDYEIQNIQKSLAGICEEFHRLGEVKDIMPEYLKGE